MSNRLNRTSDLWGVYDSRSEVSELQIVMMSTVLSERVSHHGGSRTGWGGPVSKTFPVPRRLIYQSVLAWERHCGGGTRR